MTRASFHVCRGQREVQASLREKLGLKEDALKEPPSLEECAMALAYNRVNEGLLESSIMDLTSHAPFLDQIGHEGRKEEQQVQLRERYGNLNTEDVAEAFRIYQEAKETYPNDWNLPYLHQFQLVSFYYLKYLKVEIQQYLMLFLLINLFHQF